MRDTVFSAGGALDNLQTVSLEDCREIVRDENRCQCCIADLTHHVLVFIHEVLPAADSLGTAVLSGILSRDLC